MHPPSPLDKRVQVGPVQQTTTRRQQAQEVGLHLDRHVRQASRQAGRVFFAERRDIRLNPGMARRAGLGDTTGARRRHIGGLRKRRVDMRRVPNRLQYPPCHRNG